MTPTQPLPPFDDLLAIIISQDGTWHDYRIPLKERRRPKNPEARTRRAAEDAGKVIEYNGHRYAVRLEAASLLESWYPWTRHHWFYGIFVDRLVPRLFRIGVLFFREPSDPLHGVEVPVEPLDRLTDLSKYMDDNEVVHDLPPWAVLVNPTTVSTFAYSKVFKKAIKRNPFGLGTSVRVWVVVAIIMLVLCVLLYQGGYFG